MGKIKLLDETIANQIAAGEVVERPASVVKELVENAIDAGSTVIDVEIEEGGLALIRVADNGSGMEPDDCELAFNRHATSKLGSGKDLFAIRTLGFRGEALPSIAAVSKLACTTSSDESGLGRRIEIHGGTIRELQETSAPRGTEVSVSELFYNTPARLKYMKTVQTELGHVSDYMYRLSLAHPEIAFTLKHNGNTLLQTIGGDDMLQAIAAIYGTAVGEEKLSIKRENLDYAIDGFISKPELTRSNRGGLTLIVNGRYVRSFALHAAILQSYHTLLPINRYPVAVLRIQMDPSLVDVNVHPSKLEVRFSKEAELVKWIETLVRERLGQEVLIPSGMQTKQKPAVIQEQLELRRPEPTYQPPSGRAPSPAGYPSSERFAQSAVREQAPAFRPAYDKSASMQASDFASSAASRKYADLPSTAAKGTMEAFGERTEKFLAAPDTASAIPPFPQLSPIGQLHGTYLLAQNETGLYLIDQHAAHERLNYEYYYRKFGTPSEASQELLVPITLEFTATEALRLTEKLPLLEQAGVYLESFGGNSFLVRAYPYWLPAGEERAIIEEMCEWLLTERKAIDIAEFREKSAIMCSCKASIKANQYQSNAELEALLDRLAGCANPYTCPHGRPIVISFTTYDLEKLFKRVM